MIRTLRIQLTEECNLNCIYCCHEGTINDFSIIKNRNLINFIRACYDVLGINRIKFTGGEPLEYDESLIDIIKSVDRSDILYSIVTNATHYARFKELVDEIPNIEITISIPVPPSNSYKDIYKEITGSKDENKTLQNVLDSINYLIEKKIMFKINYVLCNGQNTNAKYIKEIIDFAIKYSNVQLRFLETAVNNTNNPNNRMRQYVFTSTDFEELLKNLSYKSIQKMKDTRSYNIYEVNNTKIKLIKFFCSNECENCPEDKTSLWLTATGCIKRCSFKATADPIKNWKYVEITQQLYNY